MRLTPARYGLLLLVAGTLFRLALVLLTRDITAMPTGGSTDDDIEFNTLARNVARGVGFANDTGRPTSFRAPGWPLFVAGLYAAVGEQAWVVYGAMCVLGGVSCLFTYLIARRLTDERTARIAGALCVVFLPHAYFAVMFWSESLFVPLFAAAVWVLLTLLDPILVPAPVGPGRVVVYGNLTLAGQLAVSAIGGLLLGASALTRPFALLAVPLFGLVLLAHLRWRGVAAALVLGLATAAVVAPWTYRNYRVHERFVPVATNGGSTFYGGNNARVATEWRAFGSWISSVGLPGRDEIMATPDEVSHDKVEWELGFRWVKANPGKWLLLLPLKLARLIVWLPDFGIPTSIVARGSAWLPFLALIVAGLWRGRRTLIGPGWWLLHAAMLATFLAAMIFWGSPRFRDANAPLLMCYAALAFARRDPTPR